jgi:hypothetical protein
VNAALAKDPHFLKKKAEEVPQEGPQCIDMRDTEEGEGGTGNLFLEVTTNPSSLLSSPLNPPLTIPSHIPHRYHSHHSHYYYHHH